MEIQDCTAELAESVVGQVSQGVKYAGHLVPHRWFTGVDRSGERARRVVAMFPASDDAERDAEKARLVLEDKLASGDWYWEVYDGEGGAKRFGHYQMWVVGRGWYVPNGRSGAATRPPAATAYMIGDGQGEARRGA